MTTSPTQGEHAQPEALRLADSIEHMDTFTWYQRDELFKAATELRRLHSQVAALTAAPVVQTEPSASEDMRNAVRFAAGSAYWSAELVRFFGPNARDGINALEQQLRDALAQVRDLEAALSVQPAAPQGGAYAAHEGMTIKGDGAAMLGKLMREQRSSRLGVYPDGNPNACTTGAASHGKAPAWATRADIRACYLCGHSADAHPMEPDPRGGMRRGACPAPTAQPAPAGATPDGNPDKAKFWAWWEPYQLPEGWIARIDLVAWHAWQAATAQPAPAATPDPQAAEAERYNLMGLLAECRDAFPLPEIDSPLENQWMAAMGDPAEVPGYLRLVSEAMQDRANLLASELAAARAPADSVTAPAGGAVAGPTSAYIAAMERAWLWMENQADSQSKGGHATFDLLMLREERDALRAAIDMEVTATCPHCNGTGEVFGHAEDCTDVLCALNGDEHSCAGQVEHCQCAAAPTPAAQGDALIEALEIGLECAQQVASEHHEAYKGHRPDTHAALDADVEKIKTALAAALAQKEGTNGN